MWMVQIDFNGTICDIISSWYVKEDDIEWYVWHDMQRRKSWMDQNMQQPTHGLLSSIFQKVPNIRYKSNPIVTNENWSGRLYSFQFIGVGFTIVSTTNASQAPELNWVPNSHECQLPEASELGNLTKQMLASWWHRIETVRSSLGFAMKIDMRSLIDKRFSGCISHLCHRTSRLFHFLSQQSVFRNLPPSWDLHSFVYEVFTKFIVLQKWVNSSQKWVSSVSAWSASPRRR